MEFVVCLFFVYFIFILYKLKYILFLFFGWVGGGVELSSIMPLLHSVWNIHIVCSHFLGQEAVSVFILTNCQNRLKRKPVWYFHRIADVIYNTLSLWSIFPRSVSPASLRFLTEAAGSKRSNLQLHNSKHACLLGMRLALRKCQSLFTIFLACVPSVYKGCTGTLGPWT